MSCDMTVIYGHVMYWFDKLLYIGNKKYIIHQVIIETIKTVLISNKILLIIFNDVSTLL